ncbi:MAG TPA: NlpC/P60 family protein [Telluria sp.]|nr:NlpC/P60 family protein [Telluria sp.]
MRAIGPPFEPRETALLIEQARALVNVVPFRHQGRSMRGVDCAGLVALCLRSMGKPFLDLDAYGREPLNGRLREVLIANLGEPLPKDEMRAGDVAHVRFQGEPRHVALIVDYAPSGFAMIHAYSQVQKVVEHRIDTEWHGSIVEVFRP